MRLVVFHAMKLGRNFCRIRLEGLRQRLWYARKLRQDLHALSRERWHAHCVEKFCAQPRARVARHGHVVDILEFQPRLAQTITNSLRREASSILHAVESFFFHSSYK